MRYLPTIALILILPATAARAQTIPPTAISTECDAIVSPSRNDLESWLAGSAWTEALRFYVRDLHSGAAPAFRTRWDKLTQEMSAAFRAGECNYDRVNGTLNGRVFKAPPDLIPMDEDFGMPLPVAMAAADSACRTGDRASAIMYLKPAANSGNQAALAALVVLESVDSPDVAMARVTAEAAQASVEVELAGCLASVRAGTPNAAWCAAADRVMETRQAIRIQELVRAREDGIRGTSGGSR